MASEFGAMVPDVLGSPLACVETGTVQVNMGFRCNQQCAHCHLEAGPDRDNQMSRQTVDDVLRVLKRLGRPTLDITGGAPELNTEFGRLVQGGREAGCPVMVRTNLTALLERPELPPFLTEHEATVIASMPCYSPENVERQRGADVYGKSIAALKNLNGLAYGSGPRLELNLVYNPGGAFLPPSQKDLEQDYKQHLGEKFGIKFNHLFALADVAVGRFAEALEREGELDEYRRMLRRSFNAATIESLMCRHQTSVGPDGTLYDCDFNLALGMPVSNPGCRHVRDMTPDALIGREIVTDEHCFACTAGAGSSCKGVLAPI